MERKWKGGLDKYGLKLLEVGDTTAIPFEDKQSEMRIRKAVDNRNSRTEQYYSIKKVESMIMVRRVA